MSIITLVTHQLSNHLQLSKAKDQHEKEYAEKVKAGKLAKAKVGVLFGSR